MNKTVVITGGSGATGTLAAKKFAELGANLALLERDPSKLASLSHSLALPQNRLFTHPVDLLDGQALRSAAEAVQSKFGSIHALIHLIGGWTGGKIIAETDPADLESMLNQHVRSTFNVFHAFAPRIAESNWGRVIVVSQSTTVKPAPKSGVYAAAKSAQESLTLTLAEEYKDKGLTANIIQVKSIDTKGEGQGTSPAEIVASMLYLFSEETNKVTGARIPLY